MHRQARFRMHGHDAVAVLALLLALPGLAFAPALFFASWLAAWWFCVGLAMGAQANCWMQALTGGRWGDALRPPTLALARRLPWLLLLFLPLAAGLGRLFPWAADPGGAWAHDIERPAFAVAWHSSAFFWARMVLVGIAWWALSRPWTLARKGRAAAALIVLAITGSVAAVDLVMSLMPAWYSTGHGLVNLGGWMLGGAAIATWAATRRPPPPAHETKVKVPPVWRDLGTLLLTWVMLWAYLAFVEFLIIWAENLPREVAWYVPRLDTGWGGVSVALALLQFGLPQVCLLFRSIKDDPRRLSWMAAWLVAGQLLNCAWLVLPSVSPHGVAGWWLVPLLAIAMGLPVLGRALRETAPPGSSTRAGSLETVHA